MAQPQPQLPLAAWEKAVEELVLVESPIIARLLAEARAETEARSVLRLLARRFGAVPEELAAAVRARTDVGRLERWLELTVDATSLANFREQAGL